MPKANQSEKPRKKLRDATCTVCWHSLEQGLVALFSLNKKGRISAIGSRFRISFSTLKTKIDSSTTRDNNASFWRVFFCWSTHWNMPVSHHANVIQGRCERNIKAHRQSRTWPQRGHLLNHRRQTWQPMSLLPRVGESKERQKK